MNNVEINCPRCDQRLWVPSEPEGDITVTCPQCRHRWSTSKSLLERLATAFAMGVVLEAGKEAVQAADLFGINTPNAPVDPAPPVMQPSVPTQLPMTGTEGTSGVPSDDGSILETIGEFFVEILSGLFGG